MPFGDFNLDVVGLCLWALAFILSATCHEAAHALLALWGGDKTAYYAGQVTLNPLPHIQREPFGMVVVPVLSYMLMGWMLGWASAPYDPNWSDRHPKRAALMAAAGPAANFLLVLVFVVIIRLMMGAGLAFPSGGGIDLLVVPPPDSGPFLSAATRFLSISVVLNGLLGVFNLLPVPPLDGSAILDGIARGLGIDALARVMHAMRTDSMFAIIGLLIAWNLFRYIAPAVFTAIYILLFTGL